MANQTGIAIVIKAFLPTGKTLDEQFNALTIVKNAHETGDYSALLKAASVEDVKTEQKTRRVEDAAPAPATPTIETQAEAAAEGDNVNTAENGEDQPVQTEAPKDWAEQPAGDQPAMALNDTPQESGRRGRSRAA